MRPPTFLRAAASLAVAVALAVPSAGAQQPARRGYTAADVQFMQGMIGHHAQALEMTALVPARTQHDAMRLLAERIEVSQRDEIKLMRTWLASHGESVPDSAPAHAMHDMPGMSGMQGMAHAQHHAMMPGMLTPEQLAQLAAATGDEFDRLFLQFMIQHHEGALTMVASLFGSPGAAQNGDVFRFASDVDTDQRAEIARMRTLLVTFSKR